MAGTVHEDPDETATENCEGTVVIGLTSVMGNNI